MGIPQADGERISLFKCFRLLALSRESYSIASTFSRFVFCCGFWIAAKCGRPVRNPKFRTESLQSADSKLEAMANRYPW